MEDGGFRMEDGGWMKGWSGGLLRGGGGHNETTLNFFV